MERVDEIKLRLEGAGLVVKSKKRNGNDTGYQLRCESGEVVNVFDNGTITPQGKRQETFVKFSASNQGRPKGSQSQSLGRRARCSLFTVGTRRQQLS